LTTSAQQRSADQDAKIPGTKMQCALITLCGDVVSMDSNLSQAQLIAGKITQYKEYSGRTA